MIWENLLSTLFVASFSFYHHRRHHYYYFTFKIEKLMRRQNECRIISDWHQSKRHHVVERMSYLNWNDNTIHSLWISCCYAATWLNCIDGFPFLFRANKSTWISGAGYNWFLCVCVCCAPWMSSLSKFIQYIFKGNVIINSTLDINISWRNNIHICTHYFWRTKPSIRLLSIVLSCLQHSK